MPLNPRVQIRPSIKGSHEIRPFLDSLWCDVSCGGHKISSFDQSYSRINHDLFTCELFKYENKCAALLLQAEKFTRINISENLLDNNCYLLCTSGCDIHLYQDKHHHLLTGERALFFHGPGHHIKTDIKSSPGAFVLIMQLPEFILPHQKDASLYNSVFSTSPDNFHISRRANIHDCDLHVLNKLSRDEYFPQLRKHFVYGKACELVSYTLQQLVNPHVATCTAHENWNITQKAESILHQNFTSPPTLDNLARSIGTNRNKLSQSFKVVHGKTVYEYCQQYRMSIAKRMLSRHKYTVAQVAESVGYEHAGNFTSAYKRYFGELPKTTRRR